MEGIKINTYNDVVVPVTYPYRNLTSDDEIIMFIQELITFRYKKNLNAVWLHVMECHANVIQVALSHFRFKFFDITSEGTKKPLNFLRLQLIFTNMVVKYKPKIPCYVKTAAIVIHQTKEWDQPKILLVKDRFGSIRYQFPWSNLERHETISGSIHHMMADDYGKLAKQIGIIGMAENRFGSGNTTNIMVGVLVSLPVDDDGTMVRDDIKWVTIDECRQNIKGYPEEIWLDSCHSFSSKGLTQSKWKNWLVSASVLEDQKNGILELYKDYQSSRQLPEPELNLDGISKEAIKKFF